MYVVFHDPKCGVLTINLYMIKLYHQNRGLQSPSMLSLHCFYIYINGSSKCPTNLLMRLAAMLPSYICLKYAVNVLPKNSLNNQTNWSHGNSCKCPINMDQKFWFKYLLLSSKKISTCMLFSMILNVVCLL